MGFDFKFFGNVYSDLYLCANGWAGFAMPTGMTMMNEAGWFGDGNPNNGLYYFWADLDPTSTVVHTKRKIMWWQDTNGYRFTLFFKRLYASVAGSQLSAQVTFTGSGLDYIEVHYQRAVSTGMVTLGVENYDSTRQVNVQVRSPVDFVEVGFRYQSARQVAPSTVAPSTVAGMEASSAEDDSIVGGESFPFFMAGMALALVLLVGIAVVCCVKRAAARSKADIDHMAREAGATDNQDGNQDDNTDFDSITKHPNFTKNPLENVSVPVGWEVQKDDKGQQYYWHAATSRAVWSLHECV